MRHEPKRLFNPTGSRRDPRGLPPDLAFLCALGVGRADLERARHEALRLAMPASAVLIGSGTVSAFFYYKGLADHLGLPFVDGAASLAPEIDPASAVRLGCARLTSDPRGSWLVAPRDSAIHTLLAARANRLRMPRIAITTPAHFSGLLCQHAGAAIAASASLDLIERDPDLSAKVAVETMGRWAGLGAALILAAACLAPRLAMTILGLLFFAAITGRLLICAHGLRPLASGTRASLRDEDLPVYSVLVPLNDEAAMVPSLIANLDRLDYPAAKLQIVILLETHDRDTLAALRARSLAPVYEILVVPPGLPRTKPRALNAALSFVRGTLVTIYDAEDAPEPDQLRKAALVFHHGAPSLACVQAKLAIEGTGLLSRLFAIEYATLFDLYNVGIARAGLPMALGGTSNHFKVATLRAIDGWDAWNVTEDADLGFRLARLGYQVGMIDATTREQASLGLGGWFKQRRRWMKGWIQTFLVLARRPVRSAADLGLAQAGLVLLMAVALVVGPLLSPVFTVVVLVDLARHGLPGAGDLVDVGTSTLWVSVLLIGLAAPLWCGYAGIRARGLKGHLAVLPWIVPYQILIAAAAWASVIDLVRDPFHWHKTTHHPPVPVSGSDATGADKTGPETKKAPRWALLASENAIVQALRALRAAYFASRAALRATSSAITRDARASAAAASAAFASSAWIRSISR